MNELLIFYMLLNQVLTFIYYDSGYTNTFDRYTFPDFICLGGFSKNTTISFSNSFENTPQVFFVSEFYDFFTSPMEYKLEITAITTTSFTILISCSLNQMFSIKIRWFALDDKRIEVINNFNMNNPNDMSFLIKNPNAQFGFVAVTSIHYTGPIDFLLSITSLTTNTVTVGITKVVGKFSNLKQIGYFVIVGVEEAFINLGLKTVTGAFSSEILPIQPNRWFFIALQGLNYSNSKNLRIQASFSKTATTLSYTWGTWYQLETPNSHSQIWIAYQFTNQFKALECYTVRTSRKFMRDLSNFPTIFLEFLSLNQNYTTIGNYNYLVDKSITPLMMKIEVKCQSQMKIVAQFNKCNSCSFQKNHQFSYNCFYEMNFVGFFPKFKQEFQQYNQLKINIQASSLEIIQILYDQKITEQTIVKIQILNL